MKFPVFLVVGGDFQFLVMESSGFE